MQGSFITDFLAASALPVSLIITSYDKQSGRNVNDAALYAVLVLRLVRFARQATCLPGQLCRSWGSGALLGRHLTASLLLCPAPVHMHVASRILTERDTHPCRMFTVLRTLYDGQLIAFSRNMFRSSWISSATSYLVSLCAGSAAELH